MTQPQSEPPSAEERPGAATVPDPQGQLVLDLDGFEGPIDLLLSLSREQKVDITKISILQLADQYLAFIHELRQLRLEIAADYLVMGAWLAYLKSRLLLPETEDEDEPTGPEMAAARAFQLRRLAAMRGAGQGLRKKLTGDLANLRHVGTSPRLEVGAVQREVAYGERCVVAENRAERGDATDHVSSLGRLVRTSTREPSPCDVREVRGPDAIEPSPEARRLVGRWSRRKARHDRSHPFRIGI